MPLTRSRTHTAPSGSFSTLSSSPFTRSPTTFMLCCRLCSHTLTSCSTFSSDISHFLISSSCLDWRCSSSVRTSSACHALVCTSLRVRKRSRTSGRSGESLSIAGSVPYRALTFASWAVVCGVFPFRCRCRFRLLPRSLQPQLLQMICILDH
jgi:hypothetical protein